MRLESKSLNIPSFVLPKKAGARVKITLADRIKFGRFYPRGKGVPTEFTLVVCVEGPSETGLTYAEREYKEIIQLANVVGLVNFGDGEYRGEFFSAKPHTRRPRTEVQPLNPTGVVGCINNNSAKNNKTDNKKEQNITSNNNTPIDKPKPVADKTDNQKGKSYYIMDDEDSDIEQEVDGCVVEHFDTQNSPKPSKKAEVALQLRNEESTKSIINGPLKAVFPRSHEKVPFVMSMNGADLKTVVNDGNVRELPSEEWMGYAQATMKGHINALKLIASRINPEAPLIDGMIAAIEGLRVERKWRWSTTLSKATTIQGALAILPLYFHHCLSVNLKDSAVWKKEVSSMGKKTKEEIPTQARPATAEDVLKAIRGERLFRPQIAIALMLGWLTCARLGCILQLEKKDVLCQEGRLAITFRRGKGVRVRGPYTVDTQPLPKEWMELYEKYTEERKTERLFPQSLQGSDLCAALRKIHPVLEQRSIRRGSLQAMAANKVDEPTLMRFSGHTQVATLRRYLNWNRENAKVQDEMQAAATSLIPKELSTTPVVTPAPVAKKEKVTATTRQATKKPSPKAPKKGSTGQSKAKKPSKGSAATRRR